MLIQEAQSSSEKVVSSACAGDEVDCPNDEPCGPNDPDPDADGICNSVDECDDQPGPATNNGCPVNSCVPYYPAYDYTNDSSFNDDDISLLQQVILDVIPGTPQGAGHCPLSR
ncbi:MAG: hypothetical protein Q8O99_07850 [bacterium]|nr:hypothetical protein [bacterium]